MTLSPGTRLGPYEVIAPIGAGGMGEVYRATDTNLKRAVALKVLPRLKKDPRQRLRDIGEARLALEGSFDADILIGSSDTSSKGGRRAWLWAFPFAAASAIAAASLAVWLERNRPPLPEVVSFEIHAPAGSKIPPGTPAISPDGGTLAYVVSGPDGTTRIHLRGIGSTESRPMPGTGKLFLWPLTGGGPPVPVGSRDGLSRGGRLSPDGQYIAYSSDESGREEVYLQPVPPATGKVKVSAAGGSQAKWSPKGGELFFIAADRTIMVVDVASKPTLSAGVPRKLFQVGSAFGNVGYDVSAEGQRLLVNQLREDVPDVPITVVLNWWVDFVKREN